MLEGLEPKQLIECGRIRSIKSRSITQRTEATIFTLDQIIDRVSPDRIVIEIPSGKVHGRHKGGGSGLSVYGFAAGAIWRACAELAPTWPIKDIEWTRTKKEKRVSECVELYGQKYIDAKDTKGADIADAIGLGRWFIERDVVNATRRSV